MTTYHEITAEQLTALASGVGGPAVMAELNLSRISLHVLLLKNLADRWPADRGPLRAAVDVLARVQREAPGIYADVISDPLVGAWLTRTGSAASPSDAAFLHLGGVAMSAALRAGLHAELTGYADAGRIVLPTVGDALLASPLTGPTNVTVTAGGVITGASGLPIDVRPLRRLRAQVQDLAIEVRLEDTNPYRNAYHAPPSDRLSAAEAAYWQRTFAGAWQLLSQCMPRWAAEIADGLRAIVPLVDLGDGSSRSGTARESVGAMAVSRPSSPVDLAVTLVHEFHHSKLSGVIDITPLYRPGGQERHRVPWKKDKRPTSGLIQGVFAFLGVAETWHHLSLVPELAMLAERQFADVRSQVGVGLTALEASAELTEPGRHFVAGMRDRFSALQALPPR